MLEVAKKSKTVKMLVRLTSDLNDRVRTRFRYHGELSGLVVDALQNTDLQRVKLVELKGVSRPGYSENGALTVRATTVTLPLTVQHELRKAAESRACSMNALMNSALAEAFRRERKRKSKEDT